jgi:hypothetical protein
MQFIVPQFIDLEDKLIGPLTLKQFLYLLAGGGVIFILWSFFTLGLFIILAIPIGIFSILLAFYKVNGRPFISLVKAGIVYFTKPRLYLWRRK